MSRGEFGGYGGGGSSYGGGYNSAPQGRNGDSEYVRLSDLISKNIQRITRNVADIQRMTNHIGKSQDVQEMFEELNHVQQSTQALVKETSNHLKQLGHLDGGSVIENKQRTIQQDKLRDNFLSVLNNFQKVQRLAAEKERQSVRQARAASVNQGVPQYVPQDTSPLGGQFNEPMQVQSEADLSIDMIREREDQIRQLEKDILDVNDIFKDLATLVHEQGDMIDSIEANVEGAAISVETGNVQLEKAVSYQKSARRKKCCLLIILIIVAAALGIIIWLAAKN